MNQDLQKALWAAADRLRAAFETEADELYLPDAEDHAGVAGVVVKTLLRRYEHPSDRQEEATETVLRQAESLSAEWVMA